MSEIERLVQRIGGPIATITMNRPAHRNALSSSMLADLRAALAASADDEQTRCVLLQGNGAAFCAGADFSDVAAGAGEGVRYGGAFEHLLRDIETLRVPVVARVHGYALGAGCQILAACDLVIVAEDAVIGIPSAKLGLLLDLEKIERMIRIVGVTAVREMLLTGRNWTGQEAVDRGLALRAVAADALDDAVREICERVAAAAPLSVQGSKAAIRAIADARALRRDGDAHVFAEADAAGLRALTSDDLAEGVAALRERRPPRFVGR